MMHLLNKSGIEEYKAGWCSKGIKLRGLDNVKMIIKVLESCDFKYLGTKSIYILVNIGIIQQWKGKTNLIQKLFPHFPFFTYCERKTSRHTGELQQGNYCKTYKEVT